MYRNDRGDDLMGWFGYGIYDGDGTQTCHYDFLKKLGIEKDDDIIYEMLTLEGTVIPENKRNLLRKNYKKVFDKFSKYKFIPGRTGCIVEDKAIEIQMFGALFIDNKVKIPVQVKKKVIEATEFLLGDHASEFSNPGLRRRVLREFIETIKQS